MRTNIVKHTKGPWRIYNSDPNLIESIPTMNIVANVDSRTLSEEETRANAYLIAAAPELLEVAKEMLKAIKEADHDCKAPSGDGCASCAEITAWEESIKKAEVSV